MMVVWTVCPLAKPFTLPGAAGHGHPAVGNPRSSRPTERCILAIPLAAIVMPRRPSVTTGGRVLGMRSALEVGANPKLQRLIRLAGDAVARPRSDVVETHRLQTHAHGRRQPMGA